MSCSQLLMPPKAVKGVGDEQFDLLRAQIATCVMSFISCLWSNSQVE